MNPPNRPRLDYASVDDHSSVRRVARRLVSPRQHRSLYTLTARVLLSSTDRGVVRWWSDWSNWPTGPGVVSSILVDLSLGNFGTKPEQKISYCRKSSFHRSDLGE